MADELNALRALWLDVRDHFFEHEAMALEYDEFIELGLKHGLLTEETYEPEGQHEGVAMCGEPQDGDTVYVPTPLAKVPSEEQ